MFEMTRREVVEWNCRRLSKVLGRKGQSKQSVGVVNKNHAKISSDKPVDQSTFLQAIVNINSTLSIPALLLTPTATKQQMMFNFQSFAEVFAFDPECSYDENTVSTIEANRKELEGLFIDRVMKAMNITRREEPLSVHCGLPG